MKTPGEMRRIAVRGTVFLIFLFMVLPYTAWTAGLPASVDLGQQQAQFMVWGARSYDSIPYSSRGLSTRADVNGDGKSDLIIPVANYGGPDGSRPDSGAVFVYFGSSRLPAMADLAGTSGILPDLAVYGQVAGQRLGESTVLAGDVNGDKVDDLIIGSKGCGRIFLLFGGPGLRGVRDLADDTQDVMLICNNPTDDAYPSGITLVDINADGSEDMVIGTYLGDGPGDAKTDSGEVYVKLGGSSWPATIDLGNGGADSVIYGADPGDKLTFSTSPACADVNADGIRDIILTAPYADGPGNARPDSGEVYVFYGNVNWDMPVLDLALNQPDITVYGASDSDYLGLMSAVYGDVNSDGVDDMVLGAYNASGPGDLRPQAGEVYIVYGDSSLPQTIDLAQNPGNLIVYGGAAGDRLAYTGAITMGDFNGDGMQDISMASPLAQGENGPGSGQAYVLLGSKNLPTSLDLAENSPDLVVFGADPGDKLGYMGGLQTGDLNGDGFSDLILGAPYADGLLEERFDSGEVYVILGSPGISGVKRLRQGEEDMTLYGAEEEDSLGRYWSLYATDINDDGVDDLVTGSIFTSLAAQGRWRCGALYSVFGQTETDRATVGSYFHTGDTAAKRFNTARSTVDFDSGDSSALVSVEIVRSREGIVDKDQEKFANVAWNFNTDRQAYIANITFQYLDSEIAGLAEYGLSLYSAPTPAGPYTRVDDAVFDWATNRVRISNVQQNQSFALKEDFGLCFIQTLGFGW